MHEVLAWLGTGVWSTHIYVALKCHLVDSQNLLPINEDISDDRGQLGTTVTAWRFTE